jgi:hypothetical protein
MKERTIMMLTHPTLDQMQALGLAGMAAAYRQLAEQDNAADLSPAGHFKFLRVWSVKFLHPRGRT